MIYKPNFIINLSRMTIIFYDYNNNPIEKTLEEAIEDFKTFLKNETFINLEYKLKTTRWGWYCQHDDWDENTIYQDERIYLKDICKNSYLEEDKILLQKRKYLKDLGNSNLTHNIENLISDYSIEYGYNISFYEGFPGGSYIIFNINDLISYSIY